ncbi:UPF0481 protein At3g47200-like [Eucalyptus grandis]|uniref:UPF0481 protein At3g47200-like n=1 Tax=Eucalyptus grandis TaxID=71139 RepID=UPI00192F0A04|nr:UPF0481 protein At3g47200-like [Eucalyptus grandis]
MSNHQINQHAGIYDRFLVRDPASIHIENMLQTMPPTLSERSIFRVRHQLRKVNEKAYDPEILAIGPYHCENGKFKFMEEQKLRYLQQLLERRKESVDSYMPTLRELEERARNCYAETINLSQEKFLAMMLIDGCFIIEFFRKYNNMIPTDRDDPVMRGRGIINSIRRDLQLLENQLPLFVLSKPYDLTEDEHHEFSKVAIMYFQVNEKAPAEI